MDDLSNDTGLAGLSINPDPKLSDEKLVKLAGELASGQARHEAVLASFNITSRQFTTYIEHNPYFKRAHDAAVMDWNSANSAVKRIKIKSATSLEASLPTLHQRLNDPASALPAVVDTAKLLATLAGAGETKVAQAGSGERFSISINIGSKRIERESRPVIDVTPVPALEKPNE